MDETEIIEIWDMFKEYIPEKSRENAAGQFVEYLQGQDTDIEIFEGLLGYDPHLDSAIQLVIDEYREENFEEDSELNEWDEDENEDY